MTWGSTSHGPCEVMLGLCEFFAVCDLNGSSVYSPGSNNRDRERKSKRRQHSKFPVHFVLHVVSNFSSDRVRTGMGCVVIVVVGRRGVVRSILILCRGCFGTGATLRNGTAIFAAYSECSFDDPVGQKCRSHCYRCVWHSESSGGVLIHGYP